MGFVTPPPQETNTLYSESRTNREAMLRLRFAETLSKAKIYLLTASGADHREIQHIKEKCRSELKASAKLEQQRKASRLALEAVEASVSIDDNFETFEELNNLCGSEIVMGKFSLEKFGLGLVLKKDEEDWEEKEEREIELRKRKQVERNALKRPESTVDMYQDLDIESELNSLCGWHDGLKWIFKGYPLLGLDLVLKIKFCGDADDDGDVDDDDDNDDDLEEGEIRD